MYAKRKFRKDRESDQRNNTGVKKNIIEIEGNYVESETMQERRINVDNQIWKTLTVYNNNQTQEILESLEETIEETSEYNLIVAGDINVRIEEKGGIFIQVKTREDNK